MKRLVCVVILLALFASGCTKSDLTKNMVVPQCDNITTEHERNICYNNLAINAKHPGICKKITDRDYRKWCLGIVNKDPVSDEFNFD